MPGLLAVAAVISATTVLLWVVVSAKNGSPGAVQIVTLQIQVDDVKPIKAAQISGREISVKGEKYSFTIRPVVTDPEKGEVDITLKVDPKDRSVSDDADARGSSPVLHLTKDQPERVAPMADTQVKIRLLGIRDQVKH